MIYQSFEVKGHSSLFIDVSNKYTESEIIQLFKENDFVEYEIEDMEDGEKRLTFPEAIIDLYFEDGSLQSLNYGILFEDDEDFGEFFPN